jgi:hypothetical protein
MPTTTKAGEFVILELKRMSCVTDQYVTRAKNVAVAQYASIKSALERTLAPQGWSVRQRCFIAGARSLNEQDLHENLDYFKVGNAIDNSFLSTINKILIDKLSIRSFCY